jgi:hypothetical protein
MTGTDGQHVGLNHPVFAKADRELAVATEGLRLGFVFASTQGGGKFVPVPDL